LHESRNKVKQNFSVADSQGILAPARIPGPRAGLSASAGIAFMRLACVPVMLDQEVQHTPPAPSPPCGVGEGGSRNLRCRRSTLTTPHPQPLPTRIPTRGGEHAACAAPLCVNNTGTRCNTSNVIVGRRESPGRRSRALRLSSRTQSPRRRLARGLTPLPRQRAAASCLVSRCRAH
jgi:hypothetical protein